MSAPTDKLARWIVITLRRAAWPPTAIFGFHVIASLGFDAYDRYPPLDIPMHFLGGVVIAYFFHRAALAASECGVFGPHHALNHTLLVFALTCSATVFWEFSEFLADRFLGTHAQLGLEDTLFDMLLGILGGVAALLGTRVLGSLSAAKTNANSASAR